MKASNMTIDPESLRVKVVCRRPKRHSRVQYWVVRLAKSAGWLTFVDTVVLNSYLRWASTANKALQQDATVEKKDLLAWRVNFQSSIKRVFDVVFAIILLIAIAPSLAVITIMIRLDSPGPVFYGVRRIGKGGRQFKALKFRTMVISPEQISQEKLNRLANASMFTLRTDPRITRVGRILRKFSLDELPQVWNVLVGEMSLVGPRAPLSNLALPNKLDQYHQFSKRPGLTGLWQVQSRFDPTFERCLELNRIYSMNWSLVLDIRILAATVAILFRGDPVIIKNRLPEIGERPPEFKRGDFRVAQCDDEWVFAMENSA